MSIVIVVELLPMFPSEKVSWVRIGDCEALVASGGEDRLYVLHLFQRWKKRGSVVVVIPWKIVNAKHLHDRFVRRKNVGNVINGR